MFRRGLESGASNTVDCAADSGDMTGETASSFLLGGIASQALIAVDTEADSESAGGVLSEELAASSTSSAQLFRIGDVLFKFGSAVERGVNSGAPGFSLEPC